MYVLYDGQFHGYCYILHTYQPDGATDVAAVKKLNPLETILFDCSALDHTNG